MKVVYLGKERYRTRPSVIEFLSLAGSLGHTAVLLDRSAFLATSLVNVQIVLAKSHYKDPEVWNHLDRFSVRVINSRSATDLCRTRRTVFDALGRAGVPLLPYVQDELSASSVPLPWIAKPDRGGDHRLRIHTQRPCQLDLDRIFYQQWIPSAEVYKVYTVGRQHFLVMLRYGDERNFASAERVRVRDVPAALSDAANRVIDATGLEVLNADFIAHDQQYVAIDVNPFPGFGDVPEVAHAWWKYVSDVAVP